MEIHATERPEFHHSDSIASLATSAGSELGYEHVIGIRLPPGTPTHRVSVLSLHPTQLAVGMQQVHDKAGKAARRRDKGPAALDAWLAAHPVPVVVGPRSKGRCRSSMAPGSSGSASGGGAAAGPLGITSGSAAAVADAQATSQGAAAAAGTTEAAAVAAAAAASTAATGADTQLYLIDHHHLCTALYQCGIPDCYVGVVADYSNLTLEQFWTVMTHKSHIWPHRPDGSRVEVRELPDLLPDNVSGLADDPYRSLAALVRKAGGFNKSTRPFSEFMWANFLRSRVPLSLSSPGDVEAYVHKGVAHALSPDALAAGLPGAAPLSEASCARMDAMAALGKEPHQNS